MIFWDDVAVVLSKALAECLCRVSFRRYSPLNLEGVENRTNAKAFLATNLLGVTSPAFLWQIISAINFLPIGKLWLSSVC